MPLGASLSRADRLAGALLGQALGDALGAVVEARSPRAAREYVARWLRAGRAGCRGRGRHPFGQYTDDTQFARELLLAYRDARGFDPAGFARRLAALFATGADVGAGAGSRGAAERLLRGVAWTESGTPAPYAGNGAAMRAAPVGLLARTPDELVAAAVAQARVTHRDPRCAAGAVAVAGAAALATVEGPLDRAVFLGELAALVGPVDRDLAVAIGDLGNWVGRPPAAALRALRRRGADGSGAGCLGRTPDRDGGIPIHVVPSVLWSLYAFLQAPDDYWEVVSTAIWPGGDTDTTAAMAGAMSGARLGPGGLPPAFLPLLHDRGAWGADALTALARECAETHVATPVLGWRAVGREPGSPTSRNC